MMTTTTYKTKAGITYRIEGRIAYPEKGPARFPADLWDADCAAARGELVDGSIPRGDYRVIAAGASWLEVYCYLQR